MARELEELRREVKELKNIVVSLLDPRVSLHKDISEGVVRVLSGSNLQVLKKNLISSCPSNGECVRTFDTFLNKALEEGMGFQELETLYKEKKEKLNALEKEAPYTQCSYCFSEAFEILERQREVLKTLKKTWEGVNFGREHEPSPGEMMEGLKPLSNEVRLTILQDLYSEPRRFTHLSRATGLEGGNLRFHLNHLVSSGMVSQERRGGKYLLTERGRIVFELLSRVILCF